MYCIVLLPSLSLGILLLGGFLYLAIKIEHSDEDLRVIVTQLHS